MQIPWKLKSFIFSLIDFFNANGVLFFFQKNFTKRSKISSLKVSSNWIAHRRYLEKYGATGKVFEFGAGKSLAQNLYLSGVIEEQIVVDITPMIDIGLVEIARKLLTKDAKLKSETEIAKLQDLRMYGIQYRAPYDAANTEFESNSVDGCISTNTLEHIPKVNIVNLVNELFRILKEDGVVSARIDYSDHYSHTDKNISSLNFLKFDTNKWKKYNHKSHFQNRMRHYEFIEIFEKAGFIVVEENISFPNTDIPESLEQAFIDKDKTWKATAAHLVFKKTGN